ncbi:acyltransferase [Cronobacter dublinensis]|uniref:acyltransferase n=1 Tax=Cronobacter dublinensis TaxID=413497 RepID=UPI000CFED945|nr:acyltransferase family protein [Cronobacter dublinensis]
MKRDYSIDFARVISCFLVVMTHVSAYWNYKFQSEWEVVNFYNSLSRCAVPVFVMISGALLIKKDIQILEFYKKKIPQAFIYLVSWSVFYYVIFSNNEKGFVDFLQTFFTKQTMYHLWYLYFIVGMYLLTPFLSMIYYSLDEKQRLTALILILIFYQANLFQSLTGINLSGKFNFAYFITLNWYMMIGKYIHDIVLRGNNTLRVLTLFSLSIFATAVLNSWHSHYIGKPVSTFLDNYSLNTAIAAMCILYLSKTKLPEKIKVLASKISPYTFAIYCVHPAILIPLRPYVWEYRWGGYMVIYLPLVCIVMFLLSLAAAVVLKHTPLIKRCC